MPSFLRPREPPTLKKRVLYVEDNAVNQLVMQGMLAHRPQIQLQLADSADMGLAMAAWPRSGGGDRPKPRASSVAWR